MHLCQVGLEPRLLEEAHCTELAHIGLLPRVGHLVQPPLVWILELLVTIRALVRPHLHRLAVNLTREINILLNILQKEKYN